MSVKANHSVIITKVSEQGGSYFKYTFIDSNQPDLQFILGWDGKAQTYFSQEIKVESGEILFDSRKEIPDPIESVQGLYAVTPNAPYDEGIFYRLLADKYNAIPNF